MPHVEGESLREKLDREKQLSAKDSVTTTQKVPNALDSTHALASPESRLLYRFLKPDVNGRTELLLTPLELLESLSKFVPPPHVHRHRYHGVLARGTHRRWVARLRPSMAYLRR